ncbi:MAG: UDP-N-acetylmuramoyl-L-alanyl-D-glutamate--2,6-diaminopimelate ligase [Clostridia bacterium]|nr:UDP-N-acetylmuramoyl-L-alanyl-D-glutamate--2,6-diaminopimelate ligase [Clostridia bacterium]
MKLSFLLDCADICADGKCFDDEILHIETNTSRAIEISDGSILFICIKGAKYDTHGDIDLLIQKGIRNFVILQGYNVTPKYKDINIISCEDTRKALALMTRAFCGFPDKRLCTVAVTGTKGKTTVTYMLESILRGADIKCGIIGTNGIIYDGECFSCENSTPGSCEFYLHLSRMAERGITHVVCEVTSQALKQYRTYGTVFDVGAFTNIFPDHIGKDEHESFEEYMQCKGRLFSQCKRAVINADDGFCSYYSDICRKNGVPFELFCTSDGADCKINLPGEFNKQNAVCARSIARLLGVSEEKIAEGLASVKVSGRCERVENPAGIDIVIDYAHNGESLENILKALKKECKGRLICVFGAGGDRSRLRRSGMGEASSLFADFSIVTSDNPRSENPLDIIMDIVKGMKSEHYIVIPEREKAICYALDMAKKGDTVLLAGKGAQNYQEICGVKYPFDERIAVSQYYRNKIR